MMEGEVFMIFSFERFNLYYQNQTTCVLGFSVASGSSSLAYTAEALVSDHAPRKFEKVVLTGRLREWAVSVVR